MSNKYTILHLYRDRRRLMIDAENLDGCKISKGHGRYILEHGGVLIIGQLVSNVYRVIAGMDLNEVHFEFRATLEEKEEAALRVFRNHGVVINMIGEIEYDYRVERDKSINLNQLNIVVHHKRVEKV